MKEEIAIIVNNVDLPKLSRLIPAFVSSRIDLCCSVLVGLPLWDLERLSRVL